MEQPDTMRQSFTRFDYKEVVCSFVAASWMIHCYESFGWEQDTTLKVATNDNSVHLILRRKRKINNQVELTRLQQHFEACVREIDQLESSVNQLPTICAIAVGLIGTAFIAGSTFAVTATHPKIFLCVVLAIPGFIGWITPYFLYKYVLNKREKSISPLIEQKKDELHSICEKGVSLL